VARPAQQQGTGHTESAAHRVELLERLYVAAKRNGISLHWQQAATFLSLQAPCGGCEQENKTPQSVGPSAPSWKLLPACIPTGSPFGSARRAATVRGEAPDRPTTDSLPQLPHSCGCQRFSPCLLLRSPSTPSLLPAPPLPLRQPQPQPLPLPLFLTLALTLHVPRPSCAPSPAPACPPPHPLHCKVAPQPDGMAAAARDPPLPWHTRGLLLFLPFRAPGAPVPPVCPCRLGGAGVPAGSEGLGALGGGWEEGVGSLAPEGKHLEAPVVAGRAAPQVPGQL